MAKKFYDVCRARGFFFISANAMLALGLMKLFVSSKAYSLENLHQIMVDKKYLGILSSGVVFADETIHPFEDIPGFFDEKKDP